MSTPISVKLLNEIKREKLQAQKKKEYYGDWLIKNEMNKIDEKKKIVNDILLSENGD